jgi:hypothetical protein
MCLTMKFWVTSILAVFFALNSFAEPPISTPHPCSQSTVQDIKIELHQDSAEVPSPLIKPKPVTPLGCDRPFIYRNEVYSADSPQAQDAATLKFFTQPVPKATEYLDQYQHNRIKSEISAYTGTFGVLLLFLAPTISRNLFSNQTTRDHALTALQLGGAALAAGGFIYSFTLLRTNESLIPKAVDTFNAEKKDDPIELRFSTGWNF